MSDKTLSYLTAVGLFSVIPALSLADADAEARYPYDPACAWGRIANGKGMLVRCVTEEEARKLADVAKAPKATPSEKPEPAPSETKPEPAAKGYTLSVSEIAAEEGKIGIGKLQKPIDRYRACIDDNGGLEKPKGKIVVEFLVRAERRRAEGAEVKTYAGVQKKAAQCIAEVIDRREVGTPEVPLTGATLTIELAEQ